MAGPTDNKRLAMELYETGMSFQEVGRILQLSDSQVHRLVGKARIGRATKLHHQPARSERKPDDGYAINLRSMGLAERKRFRAACILNNSNMTEVLRAVITYLGDNPSEIPYFLNAAGLADQRYEQLQLGE